EFELLFKSATQASSFWFNGKEVFDAEASLGATYSMAWKGGSQALDFSFMPSAPTWAHWDGIGNEVVVGTDNDHDSSYDDVVVKVKASQVPEPATLALTGLGVAAVVGLRYRRRH